MLIRKRYIVLLLVCLSTLVLAQSKTGISGVIIDAETGETLPGVQVYFVSGVHMDKPTSVGTTTDIDGQFSLSNTQGLTTINYKMMGYKTGVYTMRLGKMADHMVIKMESCAIGLEEVVVKPKKEKQQYRRKGNPAVELAKNVIANKNTLTQYTQQHCVNEEYSRTSFALNNFYPNFNKPFWRDFQLIEKYIDTTTDSTAPALALSIREFIGNRYYQKAPKREKLVTTRKRVFGFENVISNESLIADIDAMFHDIDINDNDINLLYNRFVSPLSSSLAISYYQYYIQDTILLEGDSCIDLAFVPVNSESYSFTGHLYIINDSTYKVKKYTMKVPQNINLNFVSDVQIEHSNIRLDNGIWVPNRTTTTAHFYLFNKKKTIRARQTKIRSKYDFETIIDPDVFNISLASDTLGTKDTIHFQENVALWEKLRPEPLSPYESSMTDMFAEFRQTPKFNSLIMLGDAIINWYVWTVPAERWGESKWDFGPIYNTVSWNVLEGARIRIGGMTTANTNPHCFFQTYVAFGSKDLRPKYNATFIYSFNKKKYHPYEPLRHLLTLSVQYDVEEPAQQLGYLDRDNIFMSIPTSTPVMKNYQYVFRAHTGYLKEWQNALSLRANFDFEHTEAAGITTFDRVLAYDAFGHIGQTERIKHYNCFEGSVELRYNPGTPTPINRRGVESMFTLEQDAPVISLKHYIGYLDDRYSGGKGFVYNKTEITADKRFWFSSFGHLDTRLQVGYIWNQVPFTKLFMPTASTSIFLSEHGFNLMQPTEFVMDRYLGWYLTYYFKGWILNRIPGINKLRLRGVVSFSGVYGYLGKRNNPYLAGNEGLYRLVDGGVYDNQNNQYISGYTSSPIGKLPYMELTAGFENILRCIRIDYVRRLTYNDYELPAVNPNCLDSQTGEPMHFMRKIPGWGRNGIKLSVRFSL